MPDSLHRCWIFVNVEVMKDDIRITSGPQKMSNKELKKLFIIFERLDFPGNNTGSSIS